MPVTRRTDEPMMPKKMALKLILDKRNLVFLIRRFETFFIIKQMAQTFEFIVLMPNWRLCGWRNCLTNKRSWVLIEVSKNLNEWVVIAAVFVASNSRGSKEYSP